DGELLGRPLPLGEKRPTHAHAWDGVGTLNRRLLEEARPALLSGAARSSPATLRYTINNTDRAVGATLAGQIVAATGTEGLSAPIDVELEGYAGQALGFGAWGGLRLNLRGRAD